MKAGKGAIVDATFKEPNHRGLFLDLASRLQIPTLFVECRAREDEIFRRLQARGRRLGEVSDATWEVYLRQREEFAPLGDIPDHCHLTVNTEAKLEESLTRVEKFLRE